jgi:hypothetical protein
LGMAMLSIFGRHPTFMQKTLRAVCGWFLPFKAKHDCRQPAVSNGTQITFELPDCALIADGNTIAGTTRIREDTSTRVLASCFQCLSIMPREIATTIDRFNDLHVPSPRDRPGKRTASTKTIATSQNSTKSSLRAPRSYSRLHPTGQPAANRQQGEGGTAIRIATRRRKS